MRFYGALVLDILGLASGDKLGKPCATNWEIDLGYAVHEGIHDVRSPDGRFSYLLTTT